MTWYLFKGRRTEWYSIGTIEARSSQEALRMFVEKEKFLPTATGGGSWDRIAFRKELGPMDRVYYRVALKESGAVRYECMVGHDEENLAWVEEIWADNPEQALRRLVRRHGQTATHIRVRSTKLIAFTAGNSFFYVVHVPPASKAL